MVFTLFPSSCLVIMVAEVVRWCKVGNYSTSNPCRRGVLGDYSSSTLHLGMIFATMLLVSLFLTPGVFSLELTLRNECGITVWPGIAPNDGIPPLKLTATGFALHKRKSKTISLPTRWEGQIWGRTHCSVALDGKFICGTGDCASGTLECAGAGATPPVTLVDFTYCQDTESYSFALSLVYGYNVAMRVSPTGGLGKNCTDIECTMELNGMCPAPLKVADYDGVVACKSACGAFGRQDYCCTGAYNTPDTCRPSYYSKQFKIACPRAYTYAYDDVPSIITCTGAKYRVTFCPTFTSSGEPQIPVAPTNTGSSGAEAKTNSAKHTSNPLWLIILSSFLGAGTIGVSIKIYITNRRVNEGGVVQERGCVVQEGGGVAQEGGRVVQGGVVNIYLK